MCSDLVCCLHLTLILLTWSIGWAPNNARIWQMEFNLAFKGLIMTYSWIYVKPCHCNTDCFIVYCPSLTLSAKQHASVLLNLSVHGGKWKCYPAQVQAWTFLNENYWLLEAALGFKGWVIKLMQALIILNIWWCRSNILLAGWHTNLASLQWYQDWSVFHWAHCWHRDYDLGTLA